MSKEFIGEIQLIVSTFLFGTSIVCQRIGMIDGLGPLTFNSVRYAISVLWLLSFRPIYPKHEYSGTFNEDGRSFKFELIILIGAAGLANFGGSTFQQLGMVFTSATKTGFITGSYVVIIPIVEWLLPACQGSRPSRIPLCEWLGAAVCFVGLYFLAGCTVGSCYLDASSGGDGLVLVGVVFWVIGIMIADRASKKFDCLTFTTGQFVIVFILTTVLALIFELSFWAYPFTAILNQWKVLVVVGFTEAAAFLLGAIGQTYVRPSRAAILFSGGEALACYALGYLILGEKLRPLELFGALLMLAAMIGSAPPAELDGLDSESCDPLDPMDPLGLSGGDDSDSEDFACVTSADQLLGYTPVAVAPLALAVVGTSDVELGQLVLDAGVVSPLAVATDASSTSTNTRESVRIMPMSLRPATSYGAVEAVQDT